MDKLYGLIQDINPKEICNHIENGNLAEWCNAWRIAAKESLQPKTNADLIRAMSDEELAKECVRQFPMYLWPTEVRTIYFDFENHNKNNAVNAWLEWLQQPAE